jgi:hypothetical protein
MCKSIPPSVSSQSCIPVDIWIPKVLGNFHFDLCPIHFLHDLPPILNSCLFHKTSAAKKFALRIINSVQPDTPTTTTMMEDPCVAYTSEGIEYREFSCLYPALDRFYFRYVHFISLSLQCNSLWSSVPSAGAVAKNAMCHCPKPRPFCLLEKFRQTKCRAKTWDRP